VILGGGDLSSERFCYRWEKPASQFKFGGVGRGICEDGIFGKEHFSKKSRFFEKGLKKSERCDFLHRFRF
jgi:hypothetical protein